MEKSFNTEGFRDNLADDLKSIRKDDREMAKTVLDDEKNTTRYKEAAEANIENRETRVESYQDMREKILQGDYVKFKIDKTRIKTNIAESLNFTPEELQQIAVHMLSSIQDMDVSNKISKSSFGSNKYSGFVDGAANYLKTIGYEMTVENIGDALSQIIQNDGLSGYEIAHIVRGIEDEYIKRTSDYFLKFPISQEAGENLIARISKGDHNISDRRSKDKSGEQLYVSWLNGSSSIGVFDKENPKD